MFFGEVKNNMFKSQIFAFILLICPADSGVFDAPESFGALLVSTGDFSEYFDMGVIRLEGCADLPLRIKSDPAYPNLLRIIKRLLRSVQVPAIV